MEATTKPDLNHSLALANCAKKKNKQMLDLMAHKPKILQRKNAASYLSTLFEQSVRLDWCKCELLMQSEQIQIS